MHVSLAFLCGRMISLGLSRYSQGDASLLQVKRGHNVASVGGRFAVHHPYTISF